jgi:RNA polymerase sigma-70 factor, ECF subfamily
MPKNNSQLENIIEQHLKSVFNYVYKIVRNRGETEDITQDVFIKVWKNFDKFDAVKNFKTWLFAIARNTTIDHLRKDKDILFSEKAENFEESITDIEPLPDEIFVKKELGKELEIALSKIRPDFREIILLHYTEDMTFEEISEVVEKPLNTVKSQHRRALATLRKFLI